MGRRFVSHSRLADWYHQLAQLTAAGVPLAEALRESSGPPTAEREALAAALDRGESVDTVLATAPPWLPTADRFLLSAAAASGRLSETATELATQHRFLAEQGQQMLAACLYPLAVLHFALLSLPLPAVVSFSEQGGYAIDNGRYLELLAAGLGILWGGILLLGLLGRRAPRVARRLQRGIPGLRRYAHARGLSRFAWSLQALLDAGVPISEAFGGAALIADDPRLTPRLLALLPRIERGHPPGPALGGVKGLPADFIALYQSGERSGQLDRSLQTLARQYSEEARAALRRVAFWYPKLLFLLIALFVGWAVAQAFGQYLEFLDTIQG